MGVVFLGHPTRAQPREGNSERTSSSLHGCVGTTNGVPVHDQGTTLPSPSEVQNAPNQNVRRNERSCKPPQYLQELDGATWVPGPRQMQSFRHHTKRPDFSLVQQTPPHCQSHPSESYPSRSSSTSSELGHTGSRAITC